MSRSLSSSSRRMLVLGLLVAVGALFYSVIERRDSGSALATGGDFGLCKGKRGDAARECYRLEFGRELASVGSARPAVALTALAGEPTAVTFVTDDVETSPQDSLLCDLHARVGVTDADVPSWLAWTEPLATEAS